MKEKIMTGIGCYNCLKSQLVVYYEIKDKKNTHYLCDDCVKIKIVKKFWSLK